MTKPKDPAAYQRRGRPPDYDLRERVLAVSRFRPELRTQQAIADAAGCSVRLVAAVLPTLRPARGVRLTIPADLAAWAETRGGVVAVLELERAKGSG